MQYTTHYNLNLPEGTDIVNPLVQDNPNYSAIDGALYANKVRAVGNATEVKSGTVHAITRSDADIDVIRFTATGNWNTGDTMTIDGTPVSVYLPDGSAALDGAYIINSEVFGILNGTRFTLYSNSVDVTNKADKSNIASVESGTTASRAYNVGELVYVSGALYRVKAAIASGATFTVGTNVELSTVSNAIQPSPIESGTVLAVNPNITIGASYCKKVGKCVTVSITFSSSAVITTGDVFRLPWLPSDRVNPVVIGKNSDVAILYSDNYRLLLNVGSIGAASGYTLNFSYFTTD